MSTTRRAGEELSPYLYIGFGLAATTLLAFSLVAASCRLFPHGRLAASISWGQSGAAFGTLVGAVVWSRLRGRRLAIGRMGSVFAVLFSLALGTGVLVQPDATAGAIPAPEAAAYLLLSGVLAGLALTGAYIGLLRPGAFICFYLLGGAGAWAVARAGAYPDDAALVLMGAAVPAALAALLLSALYGRVVLRVTSVAVTLALALPAAFARIGLSLPGLWELSAARAEPDVAADLMWAQVIGAAAVALLASSAFIAGRHREETLGLVRLHVMALFSGAAGALLIWTVLPDFGPRWPVAWLAVGAFAGLVGSDAWPVGRLSLDRAVLGAVTAAAAALVLSGLPEGSAPYLGTIKLLLFATIGIFFSLQFPTVAHTGMLVGPVHSLWLCASAGLAAIAVTSYLAQSPFSGLLRGIPSAAMGVVPTLLFATVASDIQLPAAWPSQMWEWWRREWQPVEVAGQVTARTVTVELNSEYTSWLRFLRLLTYAGYAPWWLAGGVLRGLWSVLRMLAATFFGIITGLTGGLLTIVLGKQRETTAQVVTVDERAPVIQLSPEGEEQRVGDEPAHPEGGLGHLLTLPILWVALGAQRLTRRLLHVREPEEAERRVDEIASEAEITTEAISMGPPPDVIPGALDSDEIARAEALRRVFKDSLLHRWYRASIGRALARLIGARFRPDTAEPWDERVFRCEMVGPRGRRFELSGHLWRTRRRCGCVVTVPILSGRIEKAIEVNARHRQVRALFQQEPDRLKRILLRAAFRMAALDLSMGMASSRSVVCDSPQDDLFEPHQDRQCELREEAAGGYRCRMPLAQDAARGGSNLQACDSCNYPELWLRCASLELKGTTGYNDENSALIRQAHLLCRLDNRPVDPGECLGRDCFSPSLMTRIISVDYKHTR